MLKSLFLLAILHTGSIAFSQVTFHWNHLHYQSLAEHTADIIQLSDSGYILANDGGYFIRTNSLGEAIWHKKYSPAGPIGQELDEPQLVPADNNGFYILTSTKWGYSGYADSVII